MLHINRCLLVQFLIHCLIYMYLFSIQLLTHWLLIVTSLYIYIFSYSFSYLFVYIRLFGRHWFVSGFVFQYAFSPFEAASVPATRLHRGPLG